MTKTAKTAPRGAADAPRARYRTHPQSVAAASARAASRERLGEVSQVRERAAAAAPSRGGIVAASRAARRCVVGYRRTRKDRKGASSVQQRDQKITELVLPRRIFLTRYSYKTYTYTTTTTSLARDVAGHNPIPRRSSLSHGNPSGRRELVLFPRDATSPPFRASLITATRASETTTAPPPPPRTHAARPPSTSRAASNRRDGVHRGRRARGKERRREVLPVAQLARGEFWSSHRSPYDRVRVVNADP